MEEEKKKYVPLYGKLPEPDPIPETDVHKLMVKVQVDIANNQDDLIMKTIQEIGGSKYMHITVDRVKTIEALSKSVKQKITSKRTPVSGAFLFVCPECRHILASTHQASRPKYCSECGQALDWSEVDV